MDPPKGESAEPRNGDRLDSWKEIATHFGRTVRTVQLWEKHEDLPVYRHQHRKRGTVYAYTSELDVWWEARRDRLEKEIGERVLSRRNRWNQRAGAPALWVVLGAILLGGLTAVYRGQRSSLIPGLDGGSIVLRRVRDPGSYRLIGRPSADGRYLSYSDMSGNLALFEFASGESRRLTNKFSESADQAYWSAVSPDGTRVAYAWQHEPERYMELRVVDANGTNPRILYRDEEVREVSFVAWSADGEQILASLRLKSGKRHLVSISDKDGSSRLLEELENGSFSGMSLSPDGRYLAFGYPTGTSGGHDIRLLELETEREIPLVEGSSNDGYPLWSLSGSQIFFRSDRSGSSYGVWVVDVEDGEPRGHSRLVRKDMGQFWPLGLLSDGTYLYYLQAGSSDILVGAMDPVSIEVAGRAEVITGGRGLIAYSSAWSRDGSELAYLAGRQKRFITIRSMDSAEERELHPELRVVGRMYWGPDDRSLFVGGWDGEGSRGLFRIDVETGKVGTLFYDDAFGSFDLSPDGAKVFHTSRSGDLIVRNLVSGRSQKMYGSGIFGKIAVSPHGEWIAFTRRADTLFFMPTSGGEPTALLLADSEGLFVQDWTPDGRWLLFTRQKEGQENSLWRISPLGGEPEEVGLEMNALREVRIHPEGTRIAFTAGAPHWEVWAMENFLPELASEARATGRGGTEEAERR